MSTARTTRIPGRLGIDPLTTYQLGRVHAEFRRLGFGHLDRTERLRVTAELAGIGPIESTKELRMGEAGKVIGALRLCQTDDDLYDLIAEPEPRGMLAALGRWLRS